MEELEKDRNGDPNWKGNYVTYLKMIGDVRN